MNKTLGIVTILLATLSACGNSEKQPLKLSSDEDKGGGAAGSCRSLSYNPIAIFLDLAPVDPNSLPAGTYRSDRLEVFARDDQGGGKVQQVHFGERIMEGGGTLPSPVCQYMVDPNISVEYSFPILGELTITAAGLNNRVDATYYLRGIRNRFSSSRMGQGSDTMGLASLLAKFSQARLYLVATNLYEIRGELRQFTVKGTIYKTVAQRISFTPAP